MDKRSATKHPDTKWLTFTDAEGRRSTYSCADAYLETRGIVDAISECIARGIGMPARVSQPQSGAHACAVVDLPNCPLFLWAVLACAEVGMPLVALNHRLSPAEKALRLEQISPALTPCITIDESWESACPPDARASHGSEASTDWSPAAVLEAADADSIAVVMFTSGTTGTPKAAALTWGQLLASADASNRSLHCDAESIWQAALPLCHIGGLQVALRSMLAGGRLLLYERSNPDQLLEDAARERVSHISVVDKMLQDLIDANARRTDVALSVYSSILLGGGALNPQTLDVAAAAGAHVIASYGMTETASQVANAAVNADFDGGLHLLDGVEARVIDPDASGLGTLALRGPSIIARYLNGSAPLTEDGFFITGDTARSIDGRLHVFERKSDMFISGGENVYPAEIERCIKLVGGVTDCCVFGIPDPVWGRRPAAVVESPLDPTLMEICVRAHAQEHLSRLNQPERIIVVEALPRTELGKIDRISARSILSG